MLGGRLQYWFGEGGRTATWWLGLHCSLDSSFGTSFRNLYSVCVDMKTPPFKNSGLQRSLCPPPPEVSLGRNPPALPEHRLARHYESMKACSKAFFPFYGPLMLQISWMIRYYVPQSFYSQGTFVTQLKLLKASRAWTKVSDGELRWCWLRIGCAHNTGPI